jgi:titin
LRADSNYWFRIRGENGGTVGQDSEYMTLNWAIIEIHTPAPILSDAPSDLVVSNITSNGYKLAWSAPAYNGGSEITDFKVEVSSDSGNTWRLAKQTESTSLSLSVSGAAPGTNYLVRVSAVNAIGLSEYLFGSLTTLAVAPSAPRSVTSSGLASTSLTLSWLLPSSNGGSAITDYRVEVSSNGGLVWSTIDDGVSSNLAVDVSNLLKNKSYMFRVSAVNSVGVGSVSDVFTVSTLATVPSVPSALITSDLQSNSVVLGWSAPADFGGVSLTDYVVETSRDGIAWSVVPHAVSVARSLKITGLVPGVTYQTRVSAVSSVGQSEYLTGSFTTPLAAPNVPRSLSSSAVTSTSLTLSWLLPSSNGGSAITDYRVEVSSNCSTYTAINRVVSVNLGFKVTGLKAGTKYCFRVAAKNEIGFSTVSSILQVTTVGNAPLAPTSLSVKAAKTSVTLGWKAPTVTGGSAVRNYVVEYSKNNGVSWLKVTKAVSTSRSLIVKGLKSKTSYLFRVTAVNDVGNSPASKRLKVVTG